MNEQLRFRQGFAAALAIRERLDAPRDDGSYRNILAAQGHSENGALVQDAQSPGMLVVCDGEEYVIHQLGFGPTGIIAESHAPIIGYQIDRR